MVSMTDDERATALLQAAVDEAFPADLQSTWARHVAREQVLVGRQGIFTRRMRPFGYEFSFRTPGSDHAAASSWGSLQHERATAHVLRATFGRADLEQAAHGRWLFVRVPRSYLVGDLPLPARPDRLVIEVADHVDISPEVLAGVRRLRERGYRIAIPGFVSRPGQRLLLPHADFVKIDVRDLDVEGQPVVELARAYGALLVAEFVEEHWLLSHSRELGFDLFQGNLLERTTVVDRSAAGLARQPG